MEATTSPVSGARPRTSNADSPDSLMLTQPRAWGYVGLSRSEWFRLKSAGDLPAAVYLPGSSRPRWKRSDLDTWVERLKTTTR